MLEVASIKESDQDSRPYAQRVRSPRAARRLNHPFRYLYRHDDEKYNCNVTGVEFLMKYGGYSRERVLEMNQTFPPLLDLNVKRHLMPKLRFLNETVCDALVTLEQVRDFIPPQYFGARLERTVAPRHAFLVYHNLPHCSQLFSNSRDGKTLWEEFLLSCRKTKQFCGMCNTWLRLYSQNNGTQRVTVKQVEAFDALFARGLMAASRGELCQWNNTWPLQHINMTASNMIELLIHHGANPLERDVRGVSLLHWAAGIGNLGAVRKLLPYIGLWARADRDGATVLHWAAAGAQSRKFGCGGHLHICRFLLEQSGKDAKKLVNALTLDGNSVLHWSAWSGTLDVVKLLIRNRADPSVANRNGCTVAHWATSGGNLEVCRYLEETVKVDFSQPNTGGNTPLTHAVAFGRVDVVKWLRNEVLCDGTNDDIIASDLAKDFVKWTDGEENRKQILGMFQDWYG